MNDLVSIIIPCYNSAKYLRDTIQSILWQTHTNWECILIDDGSTDNSSAIYREFVNKDKRFRYYKQNNSGPTVARNYGIDLSFGSYIQFLDSDDIILPKRLEHCLNVFNKYADVDVVYSDYMTFESSQGYSRILPAKLPYADAIRSFLFENNQTFAVLIHSLTFKAEIMKRNKFDTKLHSHAEDVECWIRIAINGSRFEYLDEILSIYRYTPSSLGSDEVKLMTAKIHVLESYKKHPKCVQYADLFESSMLYHKQRLGIAYFMNRSFRIGFSHLSEVWKKSSSSSKIKMIAWGILMLIFSKKTIANSRAWIVKYTPFKWGAWKQIELWEPPIEVKQLLGE